MVKGKASFFGAVNGTSPKSVRRPKTIQHNEALLEKLHRKWGGGKATEGKAN